MARGGGRGRRGGGGGGGRIPPHQRDTDDTAAPIAADVAINDADAAAIAETESQAMGNKCRKDYRNRIKRFINWLSEHENYSEYYAAGTRAVSDEEASMQNKYYFDHRRDLVYRGFRGDILKAFLSNTKTKRAESDGTVILKSPRDLSKYGDAIKWGAAQAGERLPRTFFEAMDTWMVAYKKEYAGAKKDGRVEENDAQPINAVLFTLFCTWALQENNVFLWVFGLMQWNMMARSINVDPIGFHNMKRGISDSIEIVPDATKTDQAGEFVTCKNLYGNPDEPVVNLFLALAVWVSLNSSSLAQTEKLFRRDGTEEGSASKRYCRQLAEMMQRHNDEVKKHINLRRANPHGIRKVSC